MLSVDNKQEATEIFKSNTSIEDNISTIENELEKIINFCRSSIKSTIDSIQNIIENIDHKAVVKRGEICIMCPNFLLRTEIGHMLYLDFE